MKNYREYHVARSKSGKLDSVSRHETQPAAERELAALAGAIRADGDDPSDLCVVGVWSKWDDAEVLSVVGELLDYGPNGCATTCDTIIPQALPTDTDHEVPGSDVLRLGNYLLPKAPPTHFDQWFRPVHAATWHGTVTVTFRTHYTVALTWIDDARRVQRGGRADHEDLETAFANAREGVVFPAEFFEALAAPL